MKSIATQTKEQNYLAGIASGNTQIIKEVYQQYFDSIVKYVLNNKGQVEDARDLFQDAIMVIYEKTKQPDFELKHSLHTYLYAICRNLWLKKLRKKTDNGVSLPENWEPIDESEIEEHLIWRRKEKLYRQKFGLLGADCQRVISMHLAGKSMEEIALTMGYASSGYAKKRKYKCKSQLIQLIQNDSQFHEIKAL